VLFSFNNKYTQQQFMKTFTPCLVHQNIKVNQFGKMQINVSKIDPLWLKLNGQLTIATLPDCTFPTCFLTQSVQNFASHLNELGICKLHRSINPKLDFNKSNIMFRRLAVQLMHLRFHVGKVDFAHISSQFHKHFMSIFCADFLLPKNYKAKL